MVLDLLLLRRSFLRRLLCRCFFSCHRDLLVIWAAQNVEERRSSFEPQALDPLAAHGCLREPLSLVFEP